jgi:hypothetical protein
MEEVTKQITENIYHDIYEISNVSWQRKLWLNEENDTGRISSFIEVICRLFDDNNFDLFIDVTVQQIGVPENLINELNRLRTLLNNYIENEVHDETKDQAIINDLKWIRVTEQAKIVIKLWDQYKL